MDTENREYSDDEYDRMYTEGGFEGTYLLHYRHSAFFPLFRRVLKELIRVRGQRVLEVGCGTGGFAHYLMERTSLDYRGFDFSQVAVEQAKQRTGRNDAFFVGDATQASSYTVEYDSIVCTEVLEHITRDRDVVQSWKPGAICVCSVPNFNATNHVRFFRRSDEVRERYGDLLDIESVIRIKKPVLGDISLRNYLRAVRWNRDDPKQIARILGLNSFENGPGWHLFVGRRNSR